MEPIYIMTAATLLFLVAVAFVYKETREVRRSSEELMRSFGEKITRLLYEQSEKSSRRFEEQKEFLHDKIENINEKLLQKAKENQLQIEKNIELFKKMEESTNLFKTEISENLGKHFNSFSKALFEQSEKINSDFVQLNEKLSLSLKKGFEDVDKTLKEIMQANSRLFTETKDAQKNFKEELAQHLKKSFDELSNIVALKLDQINSKVEERLKEGFENVDKTFKEIITGIAKISEAQKKIEQLSGEVVSLQNVLSDKKSRGIFGEVQLNSILKSIFGENRELYDTQYQLVEDGEKVVADAVIKAPEPVGLIAIDSKFPLENYTNMIGAKEEAERKRYESSFKQNLKKHINDISSKYIVKGKTANMAILFLPAEAIFAEINAYHQDILEYARQKSVWMASPTTLMALLTTVQAIVRDVKTQEQAKKIQEELSKLSKNFRLYKERWEKLSRHIDTVSKDVKDIHVTTKKISNEFERIEKVDFSEGLIEKKD